MLITLAAGTLPPRPRVHLHRRRGFPGRPGGRPPRRGRPRPAGGLPASSRAVPGAAGRRRRVRVGRALRRDRAAPGAGRLDPHRRAPRARRPRPGAGRAGNRARPRPVQRVPLPADHAAAGRRRPARRGPPHPAPAGNPAQRTRRHARPPDPPGRRRAPRHARAAATRRRRSRPRRRGPPRPPASARPAASPPGDPAPCPACPRPASRPQTRNHGQSPVTMTAPPGTQFTARASFPGAAARRRSGQAGDPAGVPFRQLIRIPSGVPADTGNPARRLSAGTGRSGPSGGLPD